MRRYGLGLLIILMSSVAFAQHLTGYYESEPKMENFHHFRINHRHDHFEIHAYLEGGELWSSVATEITDVQKDYFIREYGQGKDIRYVHRYKVLLDGLDWEFILLSYEDADTGKNRYVVVEEIFFDETQEELLEVHVFDWSHTHHRDG